MPNYNPCLGAERCSAISEKSPCSLGYVLHPAVFDGTIHSLGTASVGKNVNDLKIFGGVGRVSIIQTENFSQHEAWLLKTDVHSKPASSNVPSPSIVLPLGGPRSRVTSLLYSTDL